MQGPKAEVHVGFRINWNDFCFPMNIIQTVIVLYLTSKKSLNQKLLDEVLSNGIEFLLDKFWLLQVPFGCGWIMFRYVCMHACTYTIMCICRHTNNKNCHRAIGNIHLKKK